jgi:hypothetical protein
MCYVSHDDGLHVESHNVPQGFLGMRKSEQISRANGREIARARGCAALPAVAAELGG